MEEDMAEVSMECHGRAKQLVVFFGAASIGTGGGWGADAVLRACCKVVCWPTGTDQLQGRVVRVDEHPHHPDQLSMIPRKPPQAPCSSQEATPAGASELGPSTPPPAKRSKHTEAEQAAEPTQPTQPTKGKGMAQGKAAKATPAPQPGRWLDRDCNAALNMQRIGESRWRPLELCYWPDQGALPAKGKEYPGLGYKRLRDKPPKAQEQQQQPAWAHGIARALEYQRIGEGIQYPLESSSRPSLVEVHFMGDQLQYGPKLDNDKLPKGQRRRWKPPEGQVEPRLLRPAWSQRRDQPVRGMMWRPVVAPRKPPQAPCRSQAATQPAASEPEPSTPPPAKRSKRTEAEQAAEPTKPTKGKGKAQGKAAKVKPAPQPGRLLDRDCNAALNMQRIGESRWRPLELCYWPDQGALPAKGKKYPGLGYKRLRDKPPKAQEQQQQQPAEAQQDTGQAAHVHGCQPAHALKLEMPQLPFAARQQLLHNTQRSLLWHSSVPPFIELLSAHNQHMFLMPILHNSPQWSGNSVGVRDKGAAMTQPAPKSGRLLDRDCNAALTMLHWEEQVASTEAVLIAGHASSASQVLGVPWSVFQGLTRPPNQAPAAAAACCGTTECTIETERWLAPIKPHLQHLAAASSGGTSLEANLKHITVTLATWDAEWEVYLDPKWARQRLRLYGAQDRALEQFFKKFEEDMAEVSVWRHGHAKQLVVYFGAASIGTGGGWGADAVLRACCKVVCRPRGAGQRRGRVVLVDEHRTTWVSSAVNGQQPCEEELNQGMFTRPAGWKPPEGQVEPGLLRPAWSQQLQLFGFRPLEVGLYPSKPCLFSVTTTTPPPAKRSKHTEAEQAAEPTQPSQPTKGKGKAQGKAAKTTPAPQPGRWLDRDCNVALNMQRIAESRWRPLELCWWPEQTALPAKGKEYPGLGYKRLRDKPPKAQEQQQQPAVAQ
ncbi:hypothetical protein QJQ45_019940 [Haematococcus lacustris]|nr:hypothetical protein QJQ45_019940 [Haematococcus lacustris]